MLLKRFDRAGDPRIPYISGLTAIQGNDGNYYSYLELVEFIEDAGSNPLEDIKELWLQQRDKEELSKQSSDLSPIE